MGTNFFDNQRYMERDCLIKENEQIDDLDRGLHIIQKKKGFKYGTDSVLLAKYVLMSGDILPAKARRRGGDLRCADFGTGTGILPLLLSRNESFTEIIGLELQTEYAEMACRNAALNGLSGRVKIIKGDIKEAAAIFGKGSMQVVVTNPPYKRADAGIRSDLTSEAIARHEIACNLEDVIRNASAVLEPGGVFFMIHRPERLADAIEYMRAFKLEPKHIRFVYPKPGRRPSVFLITGVKCGGRNLIIDKPLILMDENGEETEDLRKIYEY